MTEDRGDLATDMLARARADRLLALLAPLIDLRNPNPMPRFRIWRWWK